MESHERSRRRAEFQKLTVALPHQIVLRVLLYNLVILQRKKFVRIVHLVALRIRKVC